MAECLDQERRGQTSVYAPALRARLVSAAIILTAFMLSAAPLQPQQETPASPPELQPFEQAIDGTALSLRMIPVTVGLEPAGQPQRLWMAEKEINWDCYDVFVFGLDDSAPAGDAGADAITRPSKPYVAMDRGFGHAGFPVISVSFHGASEFCRWLSAKTGRKYRLPTEAEWRAVCALSDVDAATVGSIAWHRGNARYQTHRIGSKDPDHAGLYDLLGNAAEWCTDADGNPVVMGGSYRDKPDSLGCAARQAPTDAWNASDPQLPKSIWWLADGGFVGFRVVCDPE